MTALPVLLRECQVMARRPMNHWLRVLGAALMVFVFMGLVTRDDRNVALLGVRLFPPFHSVLLLAIWIVSPLLAADCLAQEKREGTLQLLALTRLTWSGIVTAKMLAHALRGLALVLASLPVLKLPFLLGGVSPAEITMSALLCLSALALGLGVGVAASAVAQGWARATALALVLGFVLAVVFSVAYYTCFQAWIAPLTSFGGQGRHGLTAWQLLLDYGGCWGKTVALLPPSGEAAWVALVKVLFVASGLVLVLLVQFAGWELRHNAAAAVGSRIGSKTVEVLLALRLGKRSIRKKRRDLRHNPIFWLQQRTWSARATKWGWCGAVLLAEALLMTLPMEEIRQTGQKLIGLALMLGVIYAAASSYRLEKRNGMLELILITPLSAWKLASGRTRSLWRQFLPAYVTWAVFALPPLASTLYARAPSDESLLQTVWFACTVLLVAPIVGLDSAVNFRGHWRAVLATGAAVLLIPGTIFLYGLGDGWGAPAFLGSVVIWIVGLLTTAALQLQMKERRFRYLHPHTAQRHRSKHKRHKAQVRFLMGSITQSRLQS